MFSVELTTRDGASVVFDAQATETILAAAARSHILLPSGCLQGACGACRVTCSDGRAVVEPHADSALTDAERDTEDLLLCCSRALTNLRLVAPYDYRDINFSTRSQRTARILTTTQEGANAVKLVLQLDHAAYWEQGAIFTPGQFFELSIPGTMTTRIYSLANAPNEAGILEFLIRVYPDGVFSDYVGNRARVGDVLFLRGPMGNFTMDPGIDAPPWFIAGGTGLAPILSMLREMARSGDQRRIRLFFGVNSEEELFALSAIAELERLLPHLNVTICVWTPSSAWRGFVGTPADALALALADQGGHPDIYVCGPPALVKAARSVSVSAGIDLNRFFSEQFTPA